MKRTNRRPNGPDFRVVERSPVAFVAKLVLRSRAVAVTVGGTVHLSGATRTRFLASPLWLEHERVHIEQYRRHGFWRFLALYLAESLRRGYHANRFEVEARERAAQVVATSSSAFPTDSPSCARASSASSSRGV